MGRLFEDIFSREAPVSPSEVTDLIQSTKVQRYRGMLGTGNDWPFISHLPADCLSITA